MQRIDSQHFTVHPGVGGLRTMEPYYLRMKREVETSCNIFNISTTSSLPTGYNSMSSHITGIKSHFSKSKKVQLSLGVVMVGRGLAPDTLPPPPPPQTLTRKFSKSKRSSWSLGGVVGAPPPPQTLTRKFSKSKKLS